MPFGSPGAKEFGTYFIGYSRQLWVIERMLQRMFVGGARSARIDRHPRLLDRDHRQHRSSCRRLRTGPGELGG